MLAEGQRIHHDFVKPHALLNGKTPAQAAKVAVTAASLDPWMNLLRPALEHERSIKHSDTTSV